MAATLAVTLALVVSGCGVPGNHDRVPQPWPSAVTRSATVDPQTGSIELPFDRLGISPTQARRIDYAVNLLLAECMAEAGYHLDVIDTTKGRPAKSSRRYGIWHEAEASSHGYDPVPASARQQRLEQMNSRPLPAPEEARHRTCMAKRGIRELTPPMPFFKGAEFAIYRATVESDGGRALVRDWRQCLRDQGIATRDGYQDMWLPLDATGPDSAKNKRIAVLDVRCKKRLDLVPKLAQLEAAAQAVFISQHLPALNQHRQEVHDVLAAAEQVISVSGE